MNAPHRFWPTILLFFVFILPTANAGIMATGTRLIYPQKEKERSLMLVNTNPYPVIVQIWVDDGRGDPSFSGAPFVVLPSIFRLSPGEKQGIRVIYNQEPLAKDRESVYWLNLYEIPPTAGQYSDKSRLTMAMNTQLKIFYRPEALAPLQGKMADKLRFRIAHENDQWFVECENPTPWHLSLTSLTLTRGGQTYSIPQQMDMMVAPFSQRRYPITGTLHSQHDYQILFSYIDDHGGMQNAEVKSER